MIGSVTVRHEMPMQTWHPPQRRSPAQMRQVVAPIASAMRRRDQARGGVSVIDSKRHRGPGGGCLVGLDVAVLAGGQARRMRGALGDIPKVLAPVNGRPILDHLLARLIGFGASHVVLCLGHLAPKVIAHLERASHAGLVVETVVEAQPLGTGGTLRLARPHLASDPMLVVNGDTWIDADLCAFLDSHRASAVDASVLCVEVDDVARFGQVEIDAHGRIARFAEKRRPTTGPGVASAGVYLFSQRALAQIVALPGPSLERNFLERQPPGAVHGWLAPGARFIDIGTPAAWRDAAGVMPPQPSGASEP